MYYMYYLGIKSASKQCVKMETAPIPQASLKFQDLALAAMPHITSIFPLEYWMIILQLNVKTHTHTHKPKYCFLEGVFLNFHLYYCSSDLVTNNTAELSAIIHLSLSQQNPIKAWNLLAHCWSLSCLPCICSDSLPNATILIISVQHLIGKAIVRWFSFPALLVLQATQLVGKVSGTGQICLQDHIEAPF